MQNVWQNDLLTFTSLMLQVLCRKLRLAGEVQFKAIAARTPGFVGADLRALTKEAAASAIQRIFEQPGLQPTTENLHPGNDPL